jgi:hypothetical protein
MAEMVREAVAVAVAEVVRTTDWTMLEEAVAEAVVEAVAAPEEQAEPVEAARLPFFFSVMAQEEA